MWDISSASCWLIIMLGEVLGDKTEVFSEWWLISEGRKLGVLKRAWVLVVWLTGWYGNRVFPALHPDATSTSYLIWSWVEVWGAISERKRERKRKRLEADLLELTRRISFPHRWAFSVSCATCQDLARRLWIYLACESHLIRGIGFRAH